MADVPSAILIDLLVANDGSAGCACGDNLGLLELLIDRTAAPAATHLQILPLQTRGPAQKPPARWPQNAARRGLATELATEAPHARG